MEKSKWPTKLSKQGYIVDSAQRNRFRFSSVEQALEDDDYEETSIRYAGRKQAFGADQGERPQFIRLGRRAKNS